MTRRKHIPVGSSAPECPDLREIEFTLSRHIRDPEHNPPPPGIEERRLKIYRELFYNNVESLLAGNFPVIRKTLGDAAWHALVHDFYREHRCTTPLFPEISREMLRFLEQRQSQGTSDPPWLLELAHYEWVELALEIETAEPSDIPHDPGGDLLARPPALSPVAWPLAYRWPVHRIGPEFRPEQPPPEPTFLLVRREARQVRFSEISSLTYRLLQRIGERPELGGREQLQALAVEAGSPDPDSFIAQGEQLLAQLRGSGVLLGTRTTNPEIP